MSTMKKDETSGCAYLTLIEGDNTVDKTVEINESVHLDFDKKQNILGIEILDYADVEIPVDVLSGKYGISSENISALKDLVKNSQPDPLSAID